MYGVNDISQGDKIDTQSELGDPTGSEAVIDGKTDATFCSSMIYGINKIKSVNPKAIIVFAVRWGARCIMSDHSEIQPVKVRLLSSLL